MGNIPDCLGEPPTQEGWSMGTIPATAKCCGGSKPHCEPTGTVGEGVFFFWCSDKHWLCWDLHPTGKYRNTWRKCVTHLPDLACVGLIFIRFRLGLASRILGDAKKIYPLKPPLVCANLAGACFHCQGIHTMSLLPFSCLGHSSQILCHLSALGL